MWQDGLFPSLMIDVVFLLFRGVERNDIGHSHAQYARVDNVVVRGLISFRCILSTHVSIDF
jgi:hypothetical protein